MVLPIPPPARLVNSINMRVEEDYVTDSPMLVYDGPHGYSCNLYTPEVLCSHVGCHCPGAQMICPIRGTRWYNADIHAAFLTICTARCRCEPDYVEPPDPISASETNSDTTWSTGSDTDSESDIDEHFATEVAMLRQHYVSGRLVDNHSKTCVATRSKQCDACLAGSGSGWTSRQSDCCPGFSLTPITPQDAFTEFGVSISQLVTTHASIGICL